MPLPMSSPPKDHDHDPSPHPTPIPAPLLQPNYPLPTRTIHSTIASTPTTLTLHSFTDKLLLTILQTDRLAQWIQVPLSPPPATAFSDPFPPSLDQPSVGLPSSENNGVVDGNGAVDADKEEGVEAGEGGGWDNDDDALLPMPHLTPRTLLGGGGEGKEVVGQLIACLVGSELLRREPEERRCLLVGLGLKRWEMQGREGFFELVESVGRICEA